MKRRGCPAQLSNGIWVSCAVYSFFSVHKYKYILVREQLKHFFITTKPLDVSVVSQR